MSDLHAPAVRSWIGPSPSGPRIEHGSDGWAVYGDDGPDPIHEVHFPARPEPAPGFGACSCCECLPAGTTARVLALLDADHPAARVLREATEENR